MNKIIALILISLTIWSYCEIYKKNALNRDIAYSILREKENEYAGKIIERTVPQDIKFDFKETDFDKIKKEIKSKNFTTKAVRNTR